MGLICANCGCEKIVTTEKEKKCVACKGAEIITYNEKNYGVMIKELKTKFYRRVMLQKQKRQQQQNTQK